MGTRADFYIKEINKPVQWLGSIAWDGYEVGDIGQSKTKKQFLLRLNKFLSQREDATLPENGWPWPWNNSKLTDECWLFNCEDDSIYRAAKYDGDHDQIVNALYFSKGLLQWGYDKNGDEIENPDENQLLPIILPDMKSIKNLTMGKRSGLLVVSVK